jgi:PHD/YefM family antitoxin component YafN of YafNO toxin-antitoxin module
VLYNAMLTLPADEQQTQLLDRLNETPIMLTRDGHGAGVLVHPNIWNQMVQEIARLQRINRAKKILAEMKAGDYTEEF